MAQQTPQQQLFDLLVTKNFDPETLDVNGKPAANPAEADIFNFDYTTNTGNDYGTVVIMFADDNDIQMYFGDNVGRGMEQEDKTAWFDFLSQIKQFATKNMMSFSPKDLNRLKYSMQSMAAVNESIFESWTGTKTTSWNGRPTEARLMIKHKRPLGETDARFRYVESLFIETAEGERYKLPFTKLSGGRAMVEHIRQGGKVWDTRGQHITQVVEELNVLSRFRRANHGKIFEGDTAQLVEQTNAYYETAQKTLKSMSNTRGYNSYFESWKPLEVSEEEVMIEGLKHLFVTQSLDSRIEDALPLLARIQQQGNAMKEANIFEAWAETLAEGTWALPDDKEKQAKLVEILSKELPVGADATNATEQLYNLLGDDELFDQLEALAAEDPDADCRQVILDRMSMLSDHPEVQAVITAVQVDPTATMNPAEPTNAGTSANPDDAQIPTMESDLEDVDSFGGDAADELIRGTETNQRGTDVNENDLASILRIAGVPAKERPAPDYELEENDDDNSGSGILPLAAAGGLGYAAGSGALDGIGSAIGDAFSGLIGGGAADAGAAALGAMIEDDKEHTTDLNRMSDLAGIKNEAGEGTTAQIIKKILDPIAGAVGAAAGGGGKSILIQPIGEEEKDKKDKSSVLPALAAGAAGAGLGYMAGKAMGSSSTPKSPGTSSSSGNYGSWEAPGQPSPPTATGIGLGIDAPAAGSIGDMAVSAILEKEVDETVDPDVAKAAASGGTFSALNTAVQKAGLPDMNPVTGGIKSAANTAGKIAGLPGAASKAFTAGKQSMTAETELGTAVGAGLGGAVGGLGGAALGGLAGHYLTKDKDEKVKKESDDLDRMSDLAGIKKKVADESLLAPLVGTVGGAALGGEIASGIGRQFGSEVGGAIGQAAGQEQAGKLGALVGGMKGSSAGAAAGGTAAKKFGQVAGGIAGLAGGAAIDQAKKSNDDEETDEGWKGQLAGGTAGTLAGSALGTAILPGIGTMIGAALGGTAGQMAGDKLGGNEETDEGKLGALGGGVLGMAATKSAKGAVAGAKLGSAIQDRYAKKKETPLQGEYGHSGKLEPVAEHSDFLTRLKELSGMIRN